MGPATGIGPQRDLVLKVHLTDSCNCTKCCSGANCCPSWRFLCCLCPCFSQSAHQKVEAKHGTLTEVMHAAGHDPSNFDEYRSALEAVLDREIGRAHV